MVRGHIFRSAIPELWHSHRPDLDDLTPVPRARHRSCLQSAGGHLTQHRSDQIDDATQRLLGAARVIAETDLRAAVAAAGVDPRARARAPGPRRQTPCATLLIGMHDPRPAPAYPSAGGPGSRHRARRRPQAGRGWRLTWPTSAMALRTITRQLPGDAWQFQVRVLNLARFPAAQLLTRRLVEVELHHCDLGLATAPPSGRVRRHGPG